MTNAKPTKVVTSKVRISYAHLTEPYSHNPGQDPKYSCTVLVPKTDVATKQAIDAAIEAAKQEGATSKWGGTIPANVPTPVYDGDGTRPSDGEPFGAECKGHWVFTASSKQQPGVVNVQLQAIMDPTELYSGMYGRVAVTFFPYNSNGKKGIGCGLNNVQKLADGEPLGSRSTPEEDFGAPATPAIDPITGEPR